MVCAPSSFHIAGVSQFRLVAFERLKVGELRTFRVDHVLDEAESEWYLPQRSARKTLSTSLIAIAMTGSQRRIVRHNPQKPTIPARIVIAMADNGNQGARGVWPSLELASRVADIANFIFIASLVVGICATVSIVWMSSVKEAHWDTLREKSREKVAELEAVAAKANKMAAEANERTAKAEIKLDEVRREVDRREFDKDKFLKRLETVPKMPVKVLYAANDPEAFMLATHEISAYLVASGWSVYGINLTIPPEIAQCAPYGGVAIAVSSVTDEVARDFSSAPAERKSSAWGMADAIDKGIVRSRGVGVVTCSYVEDGFLYILVSRKDIFFPKN